MISRAVTGVCVDFNPLTAGSGERQHTSFRVWTAAAHIEWRRCRQVDVAVIRVVKTAADIYTGRAVIDFLIVLYTIDFAINVPKIGCHGKGLVRQGETGVVSQRDVDSPIYRLVQRAACHRKITGVQRDGLWIVCSYSIRSGPGDRCADGAIEDDTRAYTVYVVWNEVRIGDRTAEQSIIAVIARCSVVFYRAAGGSCAATTAEVAATCVSGAG